MAAPKRSKIGDVTVDATVTRKASARVTLTRHPVEEGASPSDHAREEPESLQLECVISSFPTNKQDADKRGELERGGGKGYAEDQWQKIRRYKSDRNTLKIVTPDRTWENMVLVGLQRTDDAKTGGAVRFTADFDELRFVKNEKVRLERQTKPSKNPKKANGKVDQSKQPANQSTQDKSIAKPFTDAAGWTTPGGGVNP